MMLVTLFCFWLFLLLLLRSIFMLLMTTCCWLVQLDDFFSCEYFAHTHTHTYQTNIKQKSHFVYKKQTKAIESIDGILNNQTNMESFEMRNEKKYSNRYYRFISFYSFLFGYYLYLYYPRIYVTMYHFLIISRREKKFSR